MKKQLRFGRFIGFAVLLTALGFAARMLYGYHGVVNTKRALLALFQNCARDTESFDYDCLRQGLTPLVTSDTLTLVITSLEEIFSSNSVSLQTHGALTCHPSGHMAGEIAVQKGIAFSQVTQLCDAACDYGCTHGAFVVTLRRDPAFLGKVGSLCDDFRSSGVSRQMSSCGHVVGHGLAEVFGVDTAAALGYCRQLDNESARHACGQGVMMEHLVGLPDRPKQTQLSLDTVLAFCRSLPSAYVRECFDGVGTYAGRVTQNVEQAKMICTRVPVESMDACVQSLGGVVYYHFRHEPEKMSAYCGSMGMSSLLFCIRGALETNAGERSRLTYGRALCETLTGEVRRDCFSYFVEQVGMAWGSRVREDTCDALNREDKPVCQQ